MLNDMEELETARKRLSSIFPLSAGCIKCSISIIHGLSYIISNPFWVSSALGSLDIWLDWINDVRLMASTPTEKRQVFQMYTLAVKDYQDTAIWKSLFEFILEECADEDSDDWLTLSDIRAVSQQAMDAVGHHFCECHHVFNSIVEIELFFLDVGFRESSSWRHPFVTQNIYNVHLEIPKR